MLYLTRCQYLLRKGEFVADILLFVGEASPSSYRTVSLSGYDFDTCNSDVLINLLTVENKHLKLPSRMRYRTLSLPASKRMTPQLLQKLKQLAEGGASIIGPRPELSPSLIHYPTCDTEVEHLVEELWGNGKIRDIALEVALAELELPPDFECVNKACSLLSLHRRMEDAEIYFVCNQSSEAIETECLLHVSGKTPEFWYPNTGEIENSPIYSNEGVGEHTRTRLQLTLDPYVSVFIVLRQQKRLTHAIHIRREPVSPGVAHPVLLLIRKATYGALDSTQVMDVTDKLAALVQDGMLRAIIKNHFFGSDPASGKVKQLIVSYTLDGIDGEITVREGETLSLHSRQAAAPSGAQLVYGKQGTLELISAREGNYLVQTARGNARVKVEGTLAPITLDDAWEVSFPPGRGAPAQITLPKLISWPLHTEPGIRYFSGTAVYSRKLVVAQELLAAGGRFHLDLGDVQVLAEVQINGRNLGVLWKPPFRVDLTDNLKVGENDLRIAVTNLWPNRLIGDQQLPSDAEWTPGSFGEHIQAWPKWLLEGKPSPTGRIAFQHGSYGTKMTRCCLQGSLADRLHLPPSPLQSARSNDLQILSSQSRDAEHREDQDCC